MSFEVCSTSTFVIKKLAESQSDKSIPHDVESRMCAICKRTRLLSGRTQEAPGGLLRQERLSPLGHLYAEDWIDV